MAKGGTSDARTPGQKLDLTGATAVVTGASGGIGRGIVARFLLAGATVVAHHRADEGELRSVTLADELGLGETGRARVVPVRTDLRDAGGPQELIDAAVAATGNLDVLINNAGIQPLADLAVVDDAAWDEVVTVNLTAVQRCTQAFVRHRRNRGGGGAIVHIASIEGHQPAVSHGHYATTKAAVRMHARAAAAEFGEDGIRVNVVSPGLIERDGLREDWPEGVARWRAAAPLGRLGTPEDVGDACVALASPLMAWVTGAELVVDGGVLTRSTW